MIPLYSRDFKSPAYKEGCLQPTLSFVRRIVPILPSFSFKVELVFSFLFFLRLLCGFSFFARIRASLSASCSPSATPSRLFQLISLSYQLIWSINLSLSLKFSIRVSLSLTNCPYQHISVISSLQTYVSFLWHLFFCFSISTNLYQFNYLCPSLLGWSGSLSLSLSVLPLLSSFLLFDICGYPILSLDFSCCFPLLTVFWKLWKPQVATGMLLASRNAWSVQRGPGHELWALSGPISARAGWSRLRWSRLRRDPADLEINITAEQNLKGPESLHLPSFTWEVQHPSTATSSTANKKCTKNTLPCPPLSVPLSKTAL